MSTENPDQDPPEKPRADNGRFTKKTQTEPQGQNNQKLPDYAFMNAFMAKQLGMSDKFADLSQKFSPEDLYGHLKFTAMTSDKQQGTPSKQGLPENQPIVPVSPPVPPLELPGTQIHKPNLSQEEFSVSFSVDPGDLIKPQKKQ